jgi:hypothetical protein
VAEATPAFRGGTDPLVIGVEEIGVEEAIEAAEGEIITTMPGANLFAFSKKAFSSERGRPWEELTFSQSISSPCDTDQRDPMGVWPNLSRRSNEQQDSGRELNLK